MPSDFLLYGANGYTGALIARRAAARGLRPVLAGRNRDKVAPLAAELGLEHRIFPLTDPAAVRAALSGVRVVIHCAGPYVHTSRPVVDACLRTGTHYLDITGEWAVFEALAARDAEAKAAGVMLLPGAGCDVVPTDCLAAHLRARLPSAARLTLGLADPKWTDGAGKSRSQTISRGSATTMVDSILKGGLIRRDGVLTPVPGVSRSRRIDFGWGPIRAVSMPMGEVAALFHSTGIPNIEAYIALPGPAIPLFRLGWLLSVAPVKGLLKRLTRMLPPGPTPEERAQGALIIWEEVEDGRGQRAASRLQVPNGYALTAMAAQEIVEQVLAGAAPAGFQTPSSAYGADFILRFEGVLREDLA
jgi:short subunit dehydrogenase-like uncharacterized protein